MIFFVLFSVLKGHKHFLDSVSCDYCQTSTYPHSYLKSLFSTLLKMLLILWSEKPTWQFSNFCILRKQMKDQRLFK